MLHSGRESVIEVSHVCTPITGHPSSPAEWVLLAYPRPVSLLGGHSFLSAGTRTGRLAMASKPSSIELADTVSDLMSGVAGWLLIGLGVVGLLGGTGGIVQETGTADVIVPVLLVGFAILFIVSGVFVNPRFRRRLERRHGRSQFGQIKTVDNRTRSGTEDEREPCVVCGSRLNEGLVRRYRREYVIAGVPLWTVSENHNFYCPDCALMELSGRSTVSGDDHGTTERVVTEAE